MTRSHRLLAAVSCTAVALLIVTLRRVPTQFSDAELYASIALSKQLYGIGVPSVLRFSPLAVDHIAFYGPVFFTIVAHAFAWFGVSLAAPRVVSLMGALLMGAAAALLARSLTGTKGRWLWAVTLLALTPEIREYAAVGTMATLAIGFEMMALAVFVEGLLRDRRAWFGAVAGAFLSLAALTTPRTYLFIAAFFAAGVVSPLLAPATRRRVWRHLAAAFVTLAMGVGVWAVVSHGGVIAWARYMSFILLHEDADVAVLPTANRLWLFSVGNAAVMFISAAGGIAAARMLSRGGSERTGFAAFALLCGWLAFIAGLVTLNLTFTQSTYIALPLFIIVVAMPYEAMRLPPRLLAMAALAVLSVEIGLGGIWYARVAATWEARDPERLYRFVDRYVPDGAAVIGPPSPFFMAVERSGARFRSVSRESWADWARWVPVIEPQAVVEARRAPVTVARGRYLIWRAGDELPDGYACAAAHQIAVYEPPPTRLDLLGWLGPRTWDTGYPGATLYRLPDGCPTGYDPTHF